MLTLSLIKPEMNGFGRYRALIRELFYVKTTYFCQLNVHKCVPFHLVSLTQDKNSQIQVLPTRSGGKIGENFLLVKFPAIQYLGYHLLG